MSQGKTVAVVLGSGGARGYAHLGALQVVQERGHEIVTIAGTSMGALVGGVAAAGRLEPYTEWSLRLTQREVWRLMDFALAGGGGVIRAERIFARVGEMLEGVEIQDLAIPFTAVATDLVARREVWFQRGVLLDAIRASIAIPGVITPAVVNGRTLVDGGVLNPVPVEPTAAVPADFTLAVSLLGNRSASQPQTPERVTATPTALDALALRLRRGTADLAARIGSATRAREVEPPAQGVPSALDPAAAAASAASDSRHLPESPDALADVADSLVVPSERPVVATELGVRDLIDLSLETMSAMISRYRMASNPVDVLVQVPSNAVGTLDFHRCAEMIELGRRLTTEALDRAGL